MRVGGGEDVKRRRGKERRRQHCECAQSCEGVSVCAGCCRLTQEVHRLMRVMWSGKWAVVTPHAVLNAVWRLVPSFRGYSQQDAQEFLW